MRATAMHRYRKPVRGVVLLDEGVVVVRRMMGVVMMEREVGGL